MGLFLNKSKMSKEERIAERIAREDASLTPPTKIMEASTHAQHLVQIVRYTIEAHLGNWKNLHIRAKEMISREIIVTDKKNEIGGTIHYIKCETDHPEWPFIFVKLYEPPLITGVPGFRVRFRQLKKMDREYGLVTF